MNILVCGGRDFSKVDERRFPDKLDEYKFVMAELNKIVNFNSREYNPDDNWLPTDIKIISGGATGVDTTAIDFAIVNYIQLQVFKADWREHGVFAGPIRNQQMIDEGKPDLVVAFPGGKGTADMIRKAKKAGIPVKEISYVR